MHNEFGAPSDGEHPEDTSASPESFDVSPAEAPTPAGGTPAIGTPAIGTPAIGTPAASQPSSLTNPVPQTGGWAPLNEPSNQQVGAWQASASTTPAAQSDPGGGPPQSEPTWLSPPASGQPPSGGQAPGQPPYGGELPYG
jgi:hypothetical protein